MRSNNQLIGIACDIVKKRRPKVFVLENVPGLVSHKHGSTLNPFAKASSSAPRATLAKNGLAVMAVMTCPTIMLRRLRSWRAVASGRYRVALIADSILALVFASRRRR